jgi:hypothetical protein
VNTHILASQTSILERTDMSRLRTKATKRQRRDALAVLHEVAVDPAAADHARVAAARALVRDGRLSDDDDPDADNGGDEPLPLIVLPDNGRDPDLPRVGYGAGGRPYLAILTPEELHEVEALRVDALPPPEPKPPALTNAERQARWRGRERERRAAALMETQEAEAPAP